MIEVEGCARLEVGIGSSGDRETTTTTTRTRDDKEHGGSRHAVASLNRPSRARRVEKQQSSLDGGKPTASTAVEEMHRYRGNHGYYSGDPLEHADDSTTIERSGDRLASSHLQERNGTCDIDPCNSCNCFYSRSRSHPGHQITANSQRIPPPTCLTSPP